MKESNEELDLLIECVSNVFLIEKDRIFSKSRFKEVCYARHAFFRLARALTSKTLESIGEYLNRHHATVINSLIECDNIAAVDKIYRQKVDITTEVYLRCVNGSSSRIVNDIVGKINSND